VVARTSRDDFFQIRNYTIPRQTALARFLNFTIRVRRNSGWREPESLPESTKKPGYVFLFTSPSAVLHARWNQGAQTYPVNLCFYSLYLEISVIYGTLPCDKCDFLRLANQQLTKAAIWMNGPEPALSEAEGFAPRFWALTWVSAIRRTRLSNFH